MEKILIALVILVLFVIPAYSLDFSFTDSEKEMPPLTLDRGFATGPEWIPPVTPTSDEIPPLHLGLPTIEETFQELGLSLPQQQVFPFSIEVVNEEERAFQVTIGNPANSHVSFTATPEGIYDPEGTLVGQNWAIELNRQRFFIQIDQYSKEGIEELKITISPEEGGFPVTGSYRREFLLGNFRGEITFNGDGTNPSLSIVLKNPDHLQTEVTVGTDGPEGFDVRGREIPLGDGEVDVGRIHIGPDGADMDLDLRVTRGVYTLSLKLGNSISLGITTAEDRKREIDSRVDTMLNNDSLKQRLQELFPGMTIDEIREELIRRMTDTIKDIGDISKGVVEKIDSSQQDLITVPDSLKFFLNLGQNPSSSQKIIELVLPIVVGDLALELSAYPEMKEAKLIFNLTEAEDEHGKPHTIWEIGIQESDGEVKGIFTVTESSGLASTEVVTSFIRGIESVTFGMGDVEARFTQTGIEVGTTVGGAASSILEEIGESGLGDKVSKGKTGAGWRFLYSYGSGWELEVSHTMPYSMSSKGDKKGKKDGSNLRTFLILGPEGVRDFGVKLPVAGGILEITPQRFSFGIESDDGANYRFTGGGGSWEFEFEIPIGEAEEDKDIKNLKKGKS